MKNCDHCGAQVPEGSSFCTSCGTNFSQVAMPPPVPPPQTKWYFKTWFIIVMLVVFFPVGLILMWLGGRFNKIVRIGVTTVFALLIIAVAMSDNKTDVSTKSGAKSAAQASQAAASPAAKQLKAGDVWSSRGEEHFVKIAVRGTDLLEVSAGNPFLQIKEQACKVNPADTILSCAVTDAKGPNVKVQLEYKENKFFATITKAQDRAWGPIGLQKNEANKPAPSKRPSLSPQEQFKAEIQEINFKDALRYPGRYKNVKVAFEGSVTQAEKDLLNNFMLVNIGTNEIFLIWVDYKKKSEDPRILAGDTITVWGTINGIKTFDTALGTQSTVLRVDAKYWGIQ